MLDELCFALFKFVGKKMFTAKTVSLHCKGKFNILSLVQHVKTILCFMKTGKLLDHLIFELTKLDMLIVMHADFKIAFKKQKNDTDEKSFCYVILRDQCQKWERHILQLYFRYYKALRNDMVRLATAKWQHSHIFHS